MLVSFIEKICLDRNYKCFRDCKNNLYVAKSNKSVEYFPCVVAHTDTVHTDHGELVELKMKLDIDSIEERGENRLYAYHPITKMPTGIGGDDKCGVYICLKILESLDNVKAAFFVEEEIGMLGSKNCDESFFKDVGYALQFDAPTDNWFSRTCSGEKLWTEDYFNQISNVLSEHKIDNISYDPFTDVVQLRRKFDFCCSVLPAGYYDQHTVNEYVVPEHTEKSVQLGLDFINRLGCNKYFYV
jgi:tripeptide aminopeptidase